MICSDGLLNINGSATNYEFHLKDHLGNTRVAVNENNIVTQTNNYYPFGLTFAQSGSSTNKYLYNGKEKQEETEWLAYGNRFYDAYIGRFFNQDRFAEKYVEMSPYQYGGNNPIKFIDVNGDSIVIGTFLDRMAGYFGYKTEYVKNVESHIEEAKKDDPEIAKMILDLEASPRRHSIRPTKDDNEGNTVSINVDKARKGKKQGTTIKYNPEKRTSGKGNKGEVRHPRVGLVHELKHSSDADKGIINFNITVNRIPMYEVDAVNVENKSRKKTGDKKRTEYGGKKIPQNLLE